jgi:hypothetical protein
VKVYNWDGERISKNQNDRGKWLSSLFFVGFWVNKRGIGEK